MVYILRKCWIFLKEAIVSVLSVVIAHMADHFWTCVCHPVTDGNDNMTSLGPQGFYEDRLKECRGCVCLVLFSTRNDHVDNCLPVG